MSKDPYENAVFTQIKTSATMADGRVIESYRSYPLGVSKAEYDRIDAQLRRAFGNDGSQTVGFFQNELGGQALRSEQSRRTDALTPLPCIVCGTQLTSAANDPSFDDVPYAGTMFGTSGHYGSTAFDSFDGYRLEIVICDKCLRGKADGHVRLVSPSREKVLWDGMSSGNSDEDEG